MTDERVITGDVDARTGGVEHDGFVRISGDVRDGMTVSGKTGVQVMGHVLHGRIFSDGDITIFGDVKGEEGTLIRAGKRLIVRSVENAALVADAVICQGSLRRCRIHAYTLIEASSGEGEVAHVQCRTGDRFVANVLGAAGDHETVIDVEMAEKNRHLKKLLAAEEAIREANEELERLQRVVQMVKLMGEKVRALSEEKQRELREKLQRALELQARIRALEETRENCSAEIDRIVEGGEKHPVEVRKRVMRGVKVRIDGTDFELSESLGSGAVFYKRKRVVFRVL